MMGFTSAYLKFHYFACIPNRYVTKSFLYLLFVQYTVISKLPFADNLNHNTLCYVQINVVRFAS